MKLTWIVTDILKVLYVCNTEHKKQVLHRSEMRKDPSYPKYFLALLACSFWPFCPKCPPTSRIQLINLRKHPFTIFEVRDHYLFAHIQKNSWLSGRLKKLKIKALKFFGSYRSSCTNIKKIFSNLPDNEISQGSKYFYYISIWLPLTINFSVNYKKLIIHLQNKNLTGTSMQRSC